MKTLQLAKVQTHFSSVLKDIEAEKINFGTFTNVLNTLGYRINIEKYNLNN
jgi:hypothetical protein